MAEKLVDWTLEIGAKPFRFDQQTCPHLKDKVSALEKRLKNGNQEEINTKPD
jgi:hypothetical protein